MIKKISKQLAISWASRQIIDPTLVNVYQYGVEISVSSFVGMCIVFIAGFVFFNIVDSLLFLLTFIPIRMYCGGYHANTYLVCNLSMFFTFSTVAFIANNSNPSVLSILITGIVGSCILSLLCPVENKYKPLDKKQKKECKLISLAFLAGLILICTIMYLINCDYYKIILFTIVAVLVMVPIGIIKNYIERRSTNETHL